MLKLLGIEQVTIPLPFRLDHVNCFIAEGKNGPLVIDTGLHDQAAKAVWDEQRHKRQIKDIILTHVHPDHCGYAGTLQQQTGAAISMTKTDANAYHSIWKETAIPFLEKDYVAAAVPDEIATAIIKMTKEFISYVTPEPKVDHFLEEGEHLQIGKEMYEVIATPGHSEGLIVFYNRDRHVLLSTDHILPKITPNISYWFYGEANPLQSYENSLQKIKSLNVEYVIPSHGAPFYDANKRIEEIWAHHLERFDWTLSAIRHGATIFDVCEALFPFELNIHDYQFAIGEAVAHLEYLRAKGECKREMQAGKWIYFV